MLVGVAKARLDLLCQIGPARYHALLRKHQRASVVAVVNGYLIRTVVSQRFGTVFMVDGLGKGAACGGGKGAHVRDARKRHTPIPQGKRDGSGPAPYG